MPLLSDNLVLPRCPHCSVANPNLRRVHHFDTGDHTGLVQRKWCIYVCNSCGGVVSAWATGIGREVLDYFPEADSVDMDIPVRPRAFLQQAHESIHAPAGAVMLAASAVDAMLKLKGYTSGNLYSRIEAAANDHALTKDMAAWAHAVRLDANDQRHADEGATLPTETDAKRVIEFAEALGEFMFVLPSRIERGLTAKKA